VKGLDANKIIAALLAALLGMCAWWLRDTASEVKQLREAVVEARVDLERTSLALEFYLKRNAPPVGAPEDTEP